MTRFGITLASLIAIGGLVTIIVAQSRMVSLLEQEAELGRANPLALSLMMASATIDDAPANVENAADKGTARVDN